MCYCISAQRASNTWLAEVPLITPALKGRGFEVDQSLESRRIVKIALTILATLCILAVATAYMPIAQAVIDILGTATSMGGLCFMLLECLNNRWAADKNAANEFINSPAPAAAALDRIARSAGAAKRVAKSGVDLSKQDVSGRTLFEKEESWHSPRMTPEALLPLTESGRSIKKEDLIALIRDTEASDLMTALAKGNALKPESFTNHEQVDLWRYAGTADALHALHKCGFDVNVRNDQGYTPLMLVAGKKYTLNPFEFVPVREHGLNQAAHVRLLVALGADPKLTGGWLGRDAIGMATAEVAQAIHAVRSA